MAKKEKKEPEIVTPETPSAETSGLVSESVTETPPTEPTPPAEATPPAEPTPVEESGPAPAEATPPAEPTPVEESGPAPTEPTPPAEPEHVEKTEREVVKPNDEMLTVYENFVDETLFYLEHNHEREETETHTETESEEMETMVHLEEVQDLLTSFFPKYVEQNKRYLKNKYPELFKDEREFTPDEIQTLFNNEAATNLPEFVASLKVAMRDSIPLSNVDSLETGALTRQKNNETRKTELYSIKEKEGEEERVSLEGVSQQIEIGRGFNEQRIISTEDNENLISIIREGKVLASFQKTEDGKTKLVFQDDDLKWKFADFYAGNEALKDKFNMESGEIVIDTLSLDSRLDLRVGGANTEIGFLFSAFGLQIADNGGNSVVHRNLGEEGKIPPFDIAVSSAFIDSALKNENGCSFDTRTMSPAIRALLIGATKMQAISKEEVTRQTFEGKSEKITTISSPLKYLGKDGEQETNLQFMHRTPKGKTEAELYFYCSPRIPDSKGGYADIETTYYRVLDVQIYPTEKKGKNANYKVAGLPKDGKYLRVMIQDPKSTTKTYAICYKLDEKIDNPQLQGLVDELYGSISATANSLREKQSKSETPENIPLAMTYNEDDVASFKRRQSAVRTENVDGKVKVIPITRETKREKNSETGRTVIEKDGMLFSILSDRDRSRIVEVDGGDTHDDGDTGDVDRPHVDSEPPHVDTPPSHIDESPVNSFIPLNEIEHSREKPDIPNLKPPKDSVLKDPSLYSSIGLVTMILSVWMPFLLPFTFLSFGAALFKPWEMVRNFREYFRGLRQERRQDFNKRVRENNLTRDRLNGLVQNYNRERTALVNYKNQLISARKAIEENSYVPMPGTEKTAKQNRLAELKKMEQKTQDSLNYARSELLGYTRGLEYATRVENGCQDEVNNLTKKQAEILTAITETQKELATREIALDALNKKDTSSMSSEERAKHAEQISKANAYLEELRGKSESLSTSLTENDTALNTARANLEWAGPQKKEQEELLNMVSPEFNRDIEKYESQLSTIRNERREIENALMLDEFMSSPEYNKPGIREEYSVSLAEQIRLLDETLLTFDGIEENIHRTMDRLNSDLVVERGRAINKQVKRMDSAMETVRSGGVDAVLNSTTTTLNSRDMIENFAREEIAKINNFTPEGNSEEVKKTSVNNHHDNIASEIKAKEDEFFASITNESGERLSNSLRALYETEMQLAIGKNREKNPKPGSEEAKRLARLEEERRKRLAEFDNVSRDDPNAPRIDGYKKGLTGFLKLRTMNETKRESSIKAMGGRAR